MSASTVSEHSSAQQWGILWHKLNNSLPSPPYLWLSSTVKYWKMSKNDPKLPNVWLSRQQSVVPARQIQDKIVLRPLS